MNDEIMNYEDETEIVEYDADDIEKKGLSTGAAMLIGAGLTTAVIAAVKLGKKAIAKIKAKSADKDVYDAEEVEYEVEDEE